MAHRASAINHKRARGIADHEQGEHSRGQIPEAKMSIRFSNDRKKTVATLVLALAFLSVPTAAQVTFSKASYPLQAAPSEVVAADVNGDHKPDLVVFSAGTGKISILLNNGDGTFASALNFSAGTNPLGAFTNAYPSIAVADLDGNSRLDIVVSDPANPGSPAGPS